jgi:hypothetical protein
VKNWTVKSGNEAATSERTNVFAANAEALYILQTFELGVAGARRQDLKEG